MRMVIRRNKIFYLDIECSCTNFLINVTILSFFIFIIVKSYIIQILILLFNAKTLYLKNFYHDLSVIYIYIYKFFLVLCIIFI